MSKNEGERMSKLFSPLTMRNVTFKNRIVMSPMCMYSCNQQDGKLTDWHRVHYLSRAIGQIGLIIIESTAVTPQGRITPQDLGIWEDEQIIGLQELVNNIHEYGSKVGIQISHAGRKSQVEEDILAPSPLSYDETRKTPIEMTHQQIEETVWAFQEAAIRANEAGFDVIEIHAAHGYLLNQFLSPISNKREDEYGGCRENRFKLLKEVITSVRQVWKKPLFIRISSNEYDPEGNQFEDYLWYSSEMKNLGVDLIDCSSGVVRPTQITAYPGYHLPYSHRIKQSIGIATSAVGYITEPEQAEIILKQDVADLIFIGRELLRNPYWVYHAAKVLGGNIEGPVQYERGWRL